MIGFLAATDFRQNGPVLQRGQPTLRLTQFTLPRLKLCPELRAALRFLRVRLARPLAQNPRLVQRKAASFSQIDRLIQARGERVPLGFLPIAARETT